MKRTTVSERALVLAPIGRDATIAVTILEEAAFFADICCSLPDLIMQLDRGAAFVVLTEEALATADLGPLDAWLQDQEEWSDLPFVLLTTRGGGLERNPEARRYLNVLGNVTFLERPFHPATLVSLARSALRGRRRQYEARSRLEALHGSEARLAAALRIARLGTFEWDLVTDKVTLDRRSRDIFGLASTDDVDARKVFERIHPDDFPRVHDAAAAAIAASRPMEAEFRVALPHGSVRTVTSLSDTEPGADGKAERVVGVFADTTERAQAEEAAAAERTRQRLMLQQMPGFAAMLSGAEHRFSYVNDAYVAIAGQRDFLGHTVREVFPELEGQDFYELLDRVYANGEPFAARTMPIRLGRDGRDERFVDLLFQPVRDDTGVVSGIFVGGYDVTEHVHAQRALTLSEERYRTLFEAVDAGFCVVEMKFDEAMRPIDYRLAEINPAFERQTGLYGAAGRWASEVVPGLERHWFETYGRVALTGEAVRFEDEAVPFGRWYDVHAFRTGAPHERRVAILFNDITERKNAEDRLRELNATLEEHVAARTAERNRVWAMSRDLFAIMGFDGYLKAINPAWQATLGLDESTLLSRAFPQQVHPDDHAAVEAVIERLRRGEAVPSFEDRLRHADGSWRWIAWSLVPEGDVFYAVGRDVTTDRERQAELKAAQDELRQAQKMEAVGQLTGGIAHDFNNLLTGVIGSLDMMQRRIARGETDRVERYATAAMISANRAAALTHRLLAFSRRQPLDPKPVNANRLMTGMEELLRRTMGEAIRLEIVMAGGLWRTLCDPHQLENAILNLAINARDAMPKGGKLTIETCNAHLDDAYAARTREVKPGQYVCICVTDTGVGMAPDVIAKAFDPFFTTKPLGQGTGLGLSMIYGFTRQSEGYARIYSEVDVGTTVKLYLPRHYGESDEVEEARGEPAEVHRAEHNETVLVVEDESTVRDLVIEVLQELGYHAIEATDGPSGLRLLQSDMRIDLLVTDVGLPGLNGRQLADVARQDRPGLRVLFMTGYAENAAVANGFLEPDMKMITKPFTIDVLAARIREMIEDGR